MHNQSDSQIVYGNINMGYIYEVMDRCKETIKKSYNQNEDKYKEIFSIIGKKWECQLYCPLHAVGRFLNSEFFYDNANVKFDE